uniref:HTH cro/C1-type domain-containing protein n=1 Tax=Plectus sambesii TaxID=2011161 RepID=A0A914VGC1_9BILA
MSKMGAPSSDTDLNSVTLLRKSGPVTKTLKTSAELNAAQRKGIAIETNRKMEGGTNKQAHGPGRNAVRLDNETEELHHDRVSLSLGKVLQQARQAKEWSQKDLATKINEKPQIVAEYENGKALPNQEILGKMERILGIRLRGKEMGQPLPQKPAKK